MGSFRSQLLQSWERTHNYRKIGVTRASLDMAARGQFLLVSRIKHRSANKTPFFLFDFKFTVSTFRWRMRLSYYCKHCLGNKNQLRRRRLFLDLQISFRLLRSILKRIRQVINLLCSVCVSENVIRWRHWFLPGMFLKTSAHPRILLNAWRWFLQECLSVDFRVLQLDFIYFLVSKCLNCGHLPNVLSSLQSWHTARSSSDRNSTPTSTYSKDLWIYLISFLLLGILRCTSWFRSVCVSNDVTGVVCICLLLLRIYLPILLRRLLWLLFCILS